MPFVRKKIKPLLLTAALATSLAVPSLAQAERARTFLWGFQKDCQNLPEADRYVDKQLHAQGSEVWYLSSPQGKPLPAVCPPGSSERCGQVVKGSCPQLQGQLLGGSIFRGKDLFKFRLWLYDLQSGQVAYQDDYCQSCDITSALSAQAQRLIANPQFGNAPSSMPLYCGQPGAASGALSASNQGPVHLAVYGDGKNKTALFGALRAQIGLRGRPVLPVTIESKIYTIDVLRKIVADNKDAQVVGAEVQRDGKVGVFVFDGKTEQTADKVLDCPDCAQNKDILVARVQTEITALLDRCYGQECVNSARTAALPPEACEPFPEQACSGLDSLLSKITASPAQASQSPSSHLDSRTAKLLSGLTWGAFAASAATTLGLSIANSLVVRDINGRQYDNTLASPAAAVGGVSLLLLGVAIPSTVVINRAQRSAPHGSPARTDADTIIRCPQ